MAKRTVLPPLPKRIPSALGSIKVKLVKNLAHEGDACHGIFSWGTRTIEVNANLKGATAWMTLFHEWTHAVLADGGMDANMTLGQTEAVCDLLGTALTNLLRSGILTTEVIPKRPKAVQRDTAGSE